MRYADEIAFVTPIFSENVAPDGTYEIGRACFFFSSQLDPLGAQFDEMCIFVPSATRTGKAVAGESPAVVPMNSLGKDIGLRGAYQRCGGQPIVGFSPIFLVSGVWLLGRWLVLA